MNPFIFGETVTNENFCNRKNEIKDLVEEIKNCQNIMIFSPRRFGKTSLVFKVLEKIENKSFIPFYIDLFPVLTEKDFVDLSISSFSKLFKKDIKSMLINIKNFFKNINPSVSISVSPDGTPSANITFSEKDIIPVIKDVFNGIYNTLKSKNKKGIIVFDEFQQIGEIDNPGKIEKALRGVIQNHRNISYIFMGSKKHLLVDMFENPNRPFYKSSLHFPIDKIETDVFSVFVKNKFLKTKRNISDDLSKKIIEISENHPYYTQMLSHTIWSNSSENNTITSEHIKLAIKTILKREEPAFFNIWNNLSINQKKLLIAISSKEPEDKIFSSKIIRKYNLKSSSSIQRSMSQLEKKDIIDKNKEYFDINDVFFKHWILQIFNTKD